MKLGSKKHLQNPKLPTATSSVRGSANQRSGIVNPKNFVPVVHKKKKR